MSLSPAFAVVSSPVATTGTALRGAAPKSIETGVQGHGAGAGRMKEQSDDLIDGNWGFGETHPI